MSERQRKPRGDEITANKPLSRNLTGERLTFGQSCHLSQPNPLTRSEHAGEPGGRTPLPCATDTSKPSKLLLKRRVAPAGRDSGSNFWAGSRCRTCSHSCFLFFFSRSCCGVRTTATTSFLKRSGPEKLKVTCGISVALLS